MPNKTDHFLSSSVIGIALSWNISTHTFTCISNQGGLFSHFYPFLSWHFFHAGIFECMQIIIHVIPFSPIVYKHIVFGYDLIYCFIDKKVKKRKRAKFSLSVFFALIFPLNRYNKRPHQHTSENHIPLS